MAADEGLLCLGIRRPHSRLCLKAQAAWELWDDLEHLLAAACRRAAHWLSPLPLLHSGQFSQNKWDHCLASFRPDGTNKRSPWGGPLREVHPPHDPRRLVDSGQLRTWENSWEPERHLIKEKGQKQKLPEYLGLEPRRTSGRL